MAEAAEITPSEESLMREKLRIGKVEYDVDLTSNVLRFTRNLDKGKSTHREIQLEDIINVQVSEKTDDASFTLSFIERDKKFYWKCNRTVFKANDMDTCKRLSEKVLNAVAQKTPFRPKKLLVIVNPKSGGNKGQQIFDKQVVPLLQLAGVEVFSLVTERAGHGREYVQEFDVTSVDGILVVGGDGTLAEILDGLYRWKCKAENINLDDTNVVLPPLGIKLGIIPAGTGQGMAMAAYGVMEVNTAILQCIQGATFPLAVYTCHNGGKCRMVGDLLLSYGLFSYAIAQSEARRDLGRLRYGVGLLKGIWKIPRFQAEVQFKVAKELPPESGEKPKEEKVEGANGAASNLEEGWESVSGEFSDVNTFILMRPQGLEKYPRGTTQLNIVDTKSRINFIKFVSRVMKLQSMDDCDYVTSKFVSAFRIILKEMPNPDDKDAILAVNLDGDPFVLTDKVIEINVHEDGLQLYGSKPEDWQDGMLKKLVKR